MLELIGAQVLVCIVQFYIATSENIKRIYIVTFLFNVFNLVCYLLNGDMTTTYLYIIICIRSFIYISRDKIKQNKWHFAVPVIFIIIQLVVGFTSIDNAWQLISILIPCYVNYYLWFYDSTQKLRVGNFIGNVAWCVYNAVTGLWIIAASRAVTAGMNAAAYYKYQHSRFRHNKK
jgi:hypothetical protein